MEIFHSFVNVYQRVIGVEYPIEIALLLADPRSLIPGSQKKSAVNCEPQAVTRPIGNFSEAIWVRLPGFPAW